MKIAFFEIRPWEEEFLKSNLPEDQTLFYKQTIEQVDFSQIAGVDVLSIHASSKIDKELIDKLSNLKLIAARTTGYDNIDLNSCQEKNIIVSNVPTYGEHTVAEYAFALILSFSRKIIDASNQTKSTKHFDTTTLRGFDLKEKTLGVIGTGHIGVNVIKIAKGFEMKVVAFDAFPNQNLSQELGFEYTSLENLLASSDVITLHVPYIPQTHHLINMQNISQIKKGALLINTARGAVVETESLYKALTEEILSGAALDVLEDENLLKIPGVPAEQPPKNWELNMKLLTMKNVIVTPHNAFNTTEALQRILKETVENINSFKQNAPKNIVTPKE